jgi:hypothetical protein
MKNHHSNPLAREQRGKRAGRRTRAFEFFQREGDSFSKFDPEE